MTDFKVFVSNAYYAAYNFMWGYDAKSILKQNTSQVAGDQRITQMLANLKKEMPHLLDSPLLPVEGRVKLVEAAKGKTATTQELTKTIKGLDECRRQVFPQLPKDTRLQILNEAILEVHKVNEMKNLGKKIQDIIATCYGIPKFENPDNKIYHREDGSADDNETLNHFLKGLQEIDFSLADAKDGIAVINFACDFLLTRLKNCQFAFLPKSPLGQIIAELIIQLGEVKANAAKL